MTQQKAREILDEYEFKVTGDPKHWKKDSQRQALDNELLRQLCKAIEKQVLDEVLMKGMIHQSLIYALRRFFGQPEGKV